MRPLLFALLLIAAASASAQTIGVYRDPYATDCPVIPALAPTTVYVVATLSPAACGGIAGAAFRLVGWPQNWFYVLDTGPGVPVIPGDLFNAGTYLAWPECRASESGAIVVLSFQVFATSMVTDAPVTVTNPTTAVPPFLCPILALCDAPVYTKLCAAGVETRINPLPTGGFCPCQAPCYASCPPIGVNEASWSGIKQLYN